MNPARKAYPSDVSDEEWALVAPYLTLLPEDAGQRTHSPREVFNGLRYIIKTGAQWRPMPHDLPPWPAVYQQAQRWLASGCLEVLVDDLRALLRAALGRSEQPRAIIVDSRALRPRRKAEPQPEPAMTAPSARRARSCISRWTRWAACWPGGSRRPALMNASNWRSR